MSSPSYVQMKAVRGKVARFTLLDDCGLPQEANSMYVTRGIITANATKNMDAGDEIKVRLADGTIGEYEPGRQTLLNIGLEINMLEIDPGVINMLTDDPVVLSADGSQIVGFEEESEQLLVNNFALELWSGSHGGPCATGKPVGYWLYPLITQAYVTFDNLTDGALTPTIHGMTAGNPSWGKGPYGDTGVGGDGSSIPGPVASSTGTPARLRAALSVTAQRHFEVTVIQPPAPSGAAGPLDITLPDPY